MLQAGVKNVCDVFACQEYCTHEAQKNSIKDRKIEFKN